TSVSSATVTFSGEIDLEQQISGGASPSSAPEHITEPIEVARLGNRWRIERFTLNGTPIAYFPEGVHRTRGGIRVACAFVLSYADSASALIAVQASSPDESAQLDRVELTWSSGTTESGRAYFAHGVPSGILGFKW